MESVIVGVDGSEQSRRALLFALERARLKEWRVHIVHVVNWSRWYDSPNLRDLEQRPTRIKEERESVQRTMLDPLVEELQRENLAEGLEVQTSIHFGRPSEVLSELALKEDHGIIIIARTGDSNLKQAIFGSTANRLVQHAPVPVVVVP
ncbi:MAG: universal stress protein [Leucobacter sp.]